MWVKVILTKVYSMVWCYSVFSKTPLDVYNLIIFFCTRISQQPPDTWLRLAIVCAYSIGETHK